MEQNLTEKIKKLSQEIIILKAKNQIMKKALFILSLIIIVFIIALVFTSMGFYNYHKNTTTESQKNEKQIHTQDKNINQAIQNILEKDAKIQELYEKITEQNEEINNLKDQLKQ